MKNKNRDDGASGRRAVAVLAVCTLLGALGFGGFVAYTRIRSVWLEQSVITDIGTQVKITAGRRIKADTVRDIFGLRKGANLALIDFAAKREEALREYPVIKSLNITRKIPDRIVITITERDPFARIGIKNAKRDTGLVCDNEGVVFSCRRGAEMLPMIRDDGSSAPTPGSTLEGRASTALAILLMARDPDFANLNITEVDTSNPNFIQIFLSNYQSIKFLNEANRQQLKMAADTIAQNLQPETKVWNATQPGVVAADTKERH